MRVVAPPVLFRFADAAHVFISAGRLVAGTVLVPVETDGFVPHCGRSARVAREAFAALSTALAVLSSSLGRTVPVIRLVATGLSCIFARRAELFPETGAPVLPLLPLVLVTVVLDFPLLVGLGRLGAARR